MMAMSQLCYRWEPGACKKGMYLQIFMGKIFTASLWSGKNTKIADEGPRTETFYVC